MKKYLRVKLKNYLRAGFALLVLATMALAQTPPKTGQVATPAAGNTVSPEVVNSFLQKTFGYDPNIKWQIRDIRPASDPMLTEVVLTLSNPQQNPQGQQVMKLYVTPSGKFAVPGDLLPFGADPFAEARTKLRQAINGPSKGAANPEVLIVEFADLQCPACKQANPVMDRLMTEVPNARLVFQQFPLVQIHDWAMQAALYGQCVADQKNDAFWTFLSLVYQNQEQIKAATAAAQLKDYAGQTGVDANQVATCAAAPETQKKINASMQLAKDLEVAATPTVFVGGRRVGGVTSLPYDTLKALVQFMATQK